MGYPWDFFLGGGMGGGGMPLGPPSPYPISDQNMYIFADLSL